MGKVRLVVLAFEAGEFEVGVGVDQAGNQNRAGEVGTLGLSFFGPSRNGGYSPLVVQQNTGVRVNEAGSGVEPVG